MNRRSFTAALAAGLLGRAFANAAARRPNIVLILADDLGYGDLGCYGNAEIRTPSIDRMASEGMRFTSFYAASPVCSPSRAALLTGRLPVRSGVTRVLSPVDMRGLPGREFTIAEMLKQAGYATACIGKWHLGRHRWHLPTRRGFDHYFGIPYSNDMSRRNSPHHPLYRLRMVPPLPLMRDEKIIEREPDQSQLTRRYTEESLGFIRRSVAAKRPFFLYLPHTFPHNPLHASDRFLGKSQGGLYGDVVEELDWSTGEILRGLREADIENDTLVFFTSDNGPWLAKGEEGGSPGPLREGKGSTWEGGVRVPFIARWPGRIPKAVVTPAFGTLMDVMPTCADLTGAELPDDRVYDGQNISSVLLENASGREPLMFYWYQARLRAVRKGPWKMHLASNQPATGTRAAERHHQPLLFNLDRDASESLNVADSHPEIISELAALANRHRKSLRGDVSPLAFLQRPLR
ncbi:MAG: sulfatase [Bryobacteraceae bacterium]|nr:sulfatase [Bryobacteraceae bacterium]